MPARIGGIGSDNPALGVTMFHEAKRERFFNEADLSRIGTALQHFEDAEAATPGAIRAVRLLALTGMRLSEVLNLEWAWLDKRGSCFRLPDAKAGARAVPLGAAALEYLAGLERVGAYVCFGGVPSEPLARGTFYKFWYALAQRAKLKNSRPHDFRHTVGTYSGQTGANAFKVRDILGHKTLAMAGRYVERDVNPLLATADDVASRISGALNKDKRV